MFKFKINRAIVIASAFAVLALVVGSNAVRQKEEKNVMKSLTLKFSQDWPSASKLYEFSIPSRYRPEQVGENIIVIHVSYSELTNQIRTVSKFDDEIRVLLVVRTGLMLSENAMGRIPKTGAQLDHSKFFTDGTDIYNWKEEGKTNGVSYSSPFTLYITKSMEGNALTFEDAGDWASRYRTYKKYNEHIELDYLFPKKMAVNPIQNIKSLDAAVTLLINSFEKHRQ